MDGEECHALLRFSSLLGRRESFFEPARASAAARPQSTVSLAYSMLRVGGIYV